MIFSGAAMPPARLSASTGPRAVASAMTARRSVGCCGYFVGAVNMPSRSFVARVLRV
jgi:hypothetical protein